jgi:hypothetical protein
MTDDSVKIDFGKVERFIEDKGFGFVSHTFIEPPSRGAFFHIKRVKRNHPELAQALNTPKSLDSPYFWYEFEISEKGDKVLTILDPTKIAQNHPDNASILIEIIEKSWLDVEITLSESIRKATFDLLPLNTILQLEARRGILEENKKIPHENLQRAGPTRLQEIRTEEEEFRQLVAELSVLGFTHSNQVSKYIVTHELGCKYKHISGHLDMKYGGDAWNFKGGFPPRIYAKLCNELGLGNQGSRARPGLFIPFKDINEH